MRFFAVLLMGLFLLSACGTADLRDLQNDNEGPDEFLVIPSKPLQQPTNFSDLPQPTPGGANITDATPLADGITALGGKPSDPNGAVPSSEGTLVAYSGRFGNSPDIRGTLAAEDAEFRKRQGRLTQIRLFRTDLYREVYDRYELNPQRANSIYERAGVKTPSAPPNGS